jgi:hypothetical protein
LAVSPIAAVQQHRGLAFRCRELQPPCRGLVRHLHLGDDAGQRAVAQRVLAHGEQLLIGLALRIEDMPGAETRLLQPWGVKIEARQRPECRHAGRRREARGDPGGEQCCRGIVAPARRRARDLVQAGTVEPAAGEEMIERPDTERQHRAPRGRDARHRLAERLKLFGAWPGLGDRRCGHVGIDSNVLYMFHLAGTRVKRPAAGGCGSFRTATPSRL